MSIQLHIAAVTHCVEPRASPEGVTNRKFPLSIETSQAFYVKSLTHSVFNSTETGLLILPSLNAVIYVK